MLLEACLNDLEKEGQLIRVKEEVDPYLEMAAIQLKVYAAHGPAILFENLKNCRYRAASNIFGTPERSHYIFRKTLPAIQQLMELRRDPRLALRHPLHYLSAGFSALKMRPQKIKAPQAGSLFEEISLSDLPQIQCWPKDGGAFITLPQVYSENMDKPGIENANLGMYRIQISGNAYIPGEEAGLHYQIHRGIGIHQAIALSHHKPLKVSIFVGGPPAHTLAAVMPLPEGMSEATFAGLLGGRRFRYYTENGYTLSADADFVITGYVYNGKTKPEGPFGDHLGYYSMQHPFPVLHIHKVYARKNAIWPFTVVGRPPQEDTVFGQLIHEMTGQAIQQEIPGVKEVNAVDAAGVHPLLLAIGTERYTPYLRQPQPAEILTQANRILGTGQLSLAKYLFIAAQQSQIPSTKEIAAFLSFVLERVDFTRDLHFYTETTIDTLDYSGSGLNRGSKLVIAAAGEPRRELIEALPNGLQEVIPSARYLLPGILVMEITKFTSYAVAETEINTMLSTLHSNQLLSDGMALIVICDNSDFAAATLENFLWVSFTRSNPAKDVYGWQSFTKDKHWGSEAPLVIDARIKPQQAPQLEMDKNTLEKIAPLFEKGGSLFGIG